MKQPVVMRFPKHLLKLIKSKLIKSPVSLPVKEHYKLLGIDYLYLKIEEVKRIRVNIAGMQIPSLHYEATITSRKPDEDKVVMLVDGKVDIKTMIAMLTLIPDEETNENT